jgi:hypothetical protein
MTKEQDNPFHICTQLALQALQEATSRVRFIEQNDFTSEFRDHLPAVLQDLSKASYYLNNLKTVGAYQSLNREVLGGFYSE